MGKNGGQGRGEDWTAGIVQKGPVGIHLVPDGAGRTKRHRTSGCSGLARQGQTSASDDRDTRYGRVSRTKPVASAEDKKPVFASCTKQPKLTGMKINSG